MTVSKASLSQQPGFKFSSRYVAVFIASAIFGLILDFAGQTAFPPVNTVPYLVNTTIALVIVLSIAKLSLYLLKQSGLPVDALGLKLSPETFFNMLSGVAIGVATVALLMAGLYLFNPFRLTTGNLHGMALLRACYWYLPNNSIEELMFRGFLLVVLIRLFDWQRAALIMALPFGLFHLPYLGFTMAGLKMVLTTTVLSFVFSYAFILTRSLFTAIAVHVSMNILNHALLGLDGTGHAAYVPVFTNPWPAGYDAGFIVTLIVSAGMAGVLYLMIDLRNKTGTVGDWK